MPTSHGGETPTSEEGVLSPWVGLQAFRVAEKGAPSSGCVRLGCGNGSRNQKQLPQIKERVPLLPPLVLPLEHSSLRTRELLGNGGAVMCRVPAPWSMGRRI